MGIVKKIKRVSSYVGQRYMDKKKYKDDIRKYVAMCDADEAFLYEKETEYPVLSEYRAAAANMDVHYFIQDIWFAKKVIHNHPKEHFDIGSRVDGFLSHLLAADINVNMIDIRPLDIQIPGLSFTQGDIVNLSNIQPGSLLSLSSLHVVEHFGLGRYGDDIDPKGWIKGLKAMQKMMAMGGYFYLSFPTGRENRLYFNAHRVIEFKEAWKVLDEMRLVEAAYIKDYQLIPVAPDVFSQTVVADDFACACYIFQKL